MSEADKNHKFKGVFLNNSFETTKIDNVNSFLEKESKNNKTESWNRLDKTMKIKKLSAYVDDVVTVENSLSETEAGDLKRYLIDSLDKKKLQHVKDVCCDKVTGDIVSIPTLHFTSNIRKFTLKRSEKRVSTLKSLGKGKKPALPAAMPAAI
jgi:hypothetical protein